MGRQQTIEVTVSVTVEHRNGKFVSRDDLAYSIVDEIERVNLDYVYAGEDGSTYEVIGFEVVAE